MRSLLQNLDTRKHVRRCVALANWPAHNPAVSGIRPARSTKSIQHADQMAESPFARRYKPRLGWDIRRRTCYVSVTRKFIYFRIPKAGSASVMLNLMTAEFHKSKWPKKPNQTFRKSFRGPDDLSDDEVATLEQAYVTFGVVRNPYARFLSCYLDKIAGTIKRHVGTHEHLIRKLHGGGRLAVTNALGRDVLDDITMDEFLGFLENGGQDANVHWCRQTDLIPIGVERLSYLARLESLTEDLPPILSAIYHRPVDFERGEFRHHTAADSQLDALLDERTRRRISRLYEEDFRALNYPD